MAPLRSIVVLLAAAVACDCLVTLPLSRKMTPSKRVENVDSKGAVPLHNQFDLSYVANISFGRDHRDFVVNVDTGSSNLVVPSVSCKTCGRYKHTYNCSHDATKGITSLTYGSMVTVGLVCEDSVQIGNIIVRDQLFAVSLYEEGDYSIALARYDGILGLGFKSHEANYIAMKNKNYASEMPPNFLESMLQQGQISKLAYSLYLSSNGEAGSELIFGGSDPNHYAGELSYVPVVEQEHQEWSVNVDGLSIAGQTVASNFTVLMDTATAHLIVPATYLLPLMGIISEKLPELNLLVSEDTGNIIFFTKDVSHFRQIDISVAGVKFTLDPKDYVSPWLAGYYMMKIEFSQADKWIFGELFLRKAYLEFDMEKKRIGFAHVKQ